MTQFPCCLPDQQARGPGGCQQAPQAPRRLTQDQQARPHRTTSNRAFKAASRSEPQVRPPRDLKEGAEPNRSPSLVDSLDLQGGVGGETERPPLFDESRCICAGWSRSDGFLPLCLSLSPLVSLRTRCQAGRMPPCLPSCVHALQAGRARIASPFICAAGQSCRPAVSPLLSLHECRRPVEADQSDTSRNPSDSTGLQ